MAQLCPTRSDLMDYMYPAMPSVSMDSPIKTTGVGWHPLQGIFLTQGWNPGLFHCRQIFYHLSHQSGMIEVRIMVTVTLLWRAKRKAPAVTVIFHILRYAYIIYVKICIRLNKYHVFPLVYASYNWIFEIFYFV